MTAITTDMVLALREKTECSMMFCKAALVAAGGDMERASDLTTLPQRYWPTRTLLDKVRDHVRDRHSKSFQYEKIEDKEGFLDDSINEMTNVELLTLIGQMK